MAAEMTFWRRRIAVAGAALGVVVFLASCFIYVRYAVESSELHTQERILHAQTLGRLWSVDFYGSAILFLLSLFGLGWNRWIGLAANAGAWLFSVMTLGALCGPFSC